MRRITDRWKYGSFEENFKVFQRCKQLLHPKDGRRISRIVFGQILINFLDLAGVGVIGIIGAITVSGIQSKIPSGRFFGLLSELGLLDLTFQVQVALLGVSAALLLITRTITSIYLTKKTLFFFSRRGGEISAELVKKLFELPLTDLQKRSSQENLFSVTRGVQAITVGVLATSVNLIADISLLIIMFVGLLLVDAVTALSLGIILLGVVLLVHRRLSAKAEILGELDTKLSLLSNEKILQTIATYRENYVRNRRGYIAAQIGIIRKELSIAQAETAFMPNISKYVIESGLVISAISVSGIQFLRTDSTHAIATLTIFLAAGSRIAPAFLRVQQGAIQIRNSIGAARYSLNMIEDLIGGPIAKFNSISMATEEFVPSVRIRQLSFSYEPREAETISEVSLEILPGEVLAIVGSSGAGKSTLCDLILGILEPSAGQVLISGLTPRESIDKYPGFLAYVPQDVVIVDGTIKDNLILGFPGDHFPDELLREALTLAQLIDFVNASSHGLDTEVGEFGSLLSGGQRQRLGIARALVTSPKVLVLDEATSSLDAETEDSFSRAINSLRGKCTVVIIAHRLSTVRNAGRVAYLDAGKLKAVGTFTELRKLVPEFEKQASLMGL